MIAVALTVCPSTLHPGHRKLEQQRLPDDLDYLTLKGLRIEAAQKLQAVRPLTVGQASRISGVNPADISVLLIYLGLK